MEEKHFGPVWFIPGENRGKYPFCHSVYLEGPGILIDPSSDRGRLIHLRQGPGVKEVWLSHWHEDHLMHLDLFDDLPLVVPDIETEPLTSPEAFMDWYGMDNPEYREAWRDILIDQFHFRPRVATRTFRGGELMAFDSLTIETIRTPGHTPGHLAFFFKEQAVLFMGDYDLGKFGPWYGDRDSSIDDTIASVNKLRQIPARIWITGHETGLFESDPGEDWDRYLNIIEEREQKLLAYLVQPRTLDEIVSQWIIYQKPREPAAFFEFGERSLIGKHLERLLRIGLIRKREDHYMILSL